MRIWRWLVLAVIVVAILGMVAMASPAPNKALAWLALMLMVVAAAPVWIPAYFLLRAGASDAAADASSTSDVLE